MAARKHNERAAARRPRPSAGGKRTGSETSGAEMWLFGLHAVRAALDNPRRTKRRLLLTGEAAKRLGLGGEGPPPGAPAPEIVTREAIARVLPSGVVHQGAALLVAPLPAAGLDAAAPEPGRRALALALDRVSDPRNVGAILRAAAAFGARAVVVPERHAPPAGGALAKAASGALETVPLVRVVNLARALGELKDRGYWVVGLAADAPRTLAASAPEGHVVLVLGAEGRGLRRLTARACDVLARLPTREAQPDLNVANAAAVALYELVRAP